MNHVARRRAFSRLMKSLCGLCAVLSAAVLLVLLGYVLVKGIAYVNVEFLTALPRPLGEPGGGMVNSFAGSAIMVALASVWAVAIGIGAGIFLAEYGTPRVCEFVRLVADVLAGLPSIVIGIFGYTLLVRPMGTFSAIAGAFALGIIMLPIVARTTEESLRLVPRDLQEAALALGAPRWQAIVRVVLPCAMAGMMTGVMLAVARIAGETAPLIFTSLGNRFWNTGLTSPIAAVTLDIFQYAISPYEQWHQQAWAASFFLLAFVLTLNVGARLVTRRYTVR
ncbi:MAG TPA: phosphate ABC transporter permease PstA [Chloroflexota bacterium]|jgi:phosphate transport system permease protein